VHSSVIAHRDDARVSEFAGLRFRGTWRHYQSLALAAFERDREAGRTSTHLVAPPGSGKTLPPFCIIDGPTRGRPWSGAGGEFRRLAAEAGVRRRFAPHRLRAHALELAREGVPLNIIQRQLGHASLGTTSIYLQGSIPTRSSRPCARAARR
jgi:integrase